jgi:hypothetical protein
MFHVANAYTRAAQFEGLSAEASYRLQKVGGMVLVAIKKVPDLAWWFLREVGGDVLRSFLVYSSQVFFYLLRPYIFLPC